MLSNNEDSSDDDSDYSDGGGEIARGMVMRW